MLLSLPSLSPEIPTSFRTGKLDVRALKMALAMTRLGYLTDADFASLDVATLDADAVMSLLKTAWNRALGDLYDFTVSSADATLFFPRQGELDVYEEDHATAFAGVCFQSDTPEWIAGGKVFEALEANRKGLGKTALFILDCALCSFGIPHTIGGVLDMCSYSEWMGESDESLVLAEMESDEYDTSDVVRFDDVVAGVPEWAYKHNNKSKPLTVEQLDKHAKRLGSNPLGKLVAALARLKRLDTSEKRLFSDLEQEFEALEPPVVIGWNEPDDFSQYIDTYHDYIMQGEQSPWAGAIRFELTEQAISEAIEQIRHTGSVFKALDEVLVLIKEFQ